MGMVFREAFGVLVALAATVGAVACSPPASREAEAETERAAPDEGYRMQVFATEAGKTYLVARPDGVQVAAMVDASGAAKLVDAGDAHGAIADAAGASPTPSAEQVDVSLPGFRLKVAADEGGGDAAQVHIEAGGAKVEVNASDGPGSEQAVVRVAGASAEDAREFIADAEGLTPDVRAAMLEKLGL